MLQTISKYFIAIVFESPLQNDITAIKETVALRFNSKGALLSPAHITLQMPFALSEKKVEKLKDGLSVFAKKQLDFQLVLKNFSYFEPRVIYIDVVESELLMQLKKTCYKC